MLIISGDDRGLTLYRAPRVITAIRRPFLCMLVFGALVGLAGCNATAVERNFGLQNNSRIETLEATAQFAVVPATRAFINVPNALLVLERRLGNATEQRVTLPNATSAAGENLILLRAQTDSTANVDRLNLNEFLERFGGTPAPFSVINESSLSSGQDNMGSYVYSQQRVGTSTICVLAIRRMSVGARALPRGTGALDVLLRNCVQGTVQEALAPIGAGAFSLGSPNLASAR
jgi:hypothetical protein